MTKDKEEAVPALYEHCERAYKEMFACAAGVPMDGRDDMPPAVVYEGHLTKLFADTLHLSVPYYTSVTRALKDMGCIRQLRRGGSTGLSQWLLITEPTREKFDQRVGDGMSRRRYVTESQWRALQQQTTALNNRLLRVERALGLD